jgi:hypothetical protein
MAELPLRAAATNLVTAMARLPRMAATMEAFDSDAIPKGHCSRIGGEPESFADNVTNLKHRAGDGHDSQLPRGPRRSKKSVVIFVSLV